MLVSLFDRLAYHAIVVVATTAHVAYPSGSKEGAGCFHIFRNIFLLYIQKSRSHSRENTEIASNSG